MVSMILVADRIGELWISRIAAVLSRWAGYLGERDFRIPE